MLSIQMRSNGSHAWKNRISRGAVLLAQGDINDTLYFLLNGGYGWT